MSGSLVLYRMLTACSMLLINVWGAAHLGTWLFHVTSCAGEWCVYMDLYFTSFIPHTQSKAPYSVRYAALLCV